MRHILKRETFSMRNGRILSRSISNSHQSPLRLRIQSVLSRLKAMQTVKTAFQSVNSKVLADNWMRLVKTVPELPVVKHAVQRIRYVPIRNRDFDLRVSEMQWQKLKTDLKALNAKWSQEIRATQAIKEEPKIPLDDAANNKQTLRNKPRDQYLPFVSKTLTDTVIGAVARVPKIPSYLNFPDLFKKENNEVKVTEKNAKPAWKTKMEQSGISKSALDARTRNCVQNLKMSSINGDAKCIRALQEFCSHLYEFHFAKGVAVREGVIGTLLSIRNNTRSDAVGLLAREALQLVGYHGSPNGRGIKILCLDGGGMRGVVALEVLREIERLTGKKMCDLFDFVCGVSTGAIIAAFISFKKLSIEEIDNIYSKFGRIVFSQSLIKGATGWVMSHSYYNTKLLENTLKDFAGEEIMMHSIRSPGTPKTAMISTLVSEDHIRPYVFRNYQYPYRSQSFYRGSSRYRIWEGLRASSAAPGYFDEMHLNGKIHHDGGIIVNNATQVAIHEAQRLWPGEDLQCVVSLGTGRHERPITFEPPSESTSALSLAQKFTRIVNAATDTEIAHVTLHDLLPGEVYYRFNPCMSDYFPLDEARPEKLSEMREDTLMYLRRNRNRIRQVAQQLELKRRPMDLVKDLVNEKSRIIQDKMFAETTHF